MEEQYLTKGYQLNEYKIESVLGAGGFGVTYLATDINLNTEVVIKEFLPREFSSRNSENKSVVPYTEVNKDGTYEYFLKKFISEAQILASIKHPNIVRVFSFFKANNTAYFVMDYIKGESLKEYLARKKTLNEENIMSIIIPLLEGLKEVHEKNYLHRDIAPDNIYLRQNGMPMLIDFGSAKNATGTKSTSLATIVKAGYSAPEQYMSSSTHSPTTDIYAIGSVMYSMISGEIAPEATQRQMALLNQELDPLGELVHDYERKYSIKLLETIQKAMSIKEMDRFQNVSDMQRELTEVFSTETSNRQTKTSSSKSSWLKYVMSSLLLALLGFGGYQYKIDNDRKFSEVQEKILLAQRETNEVRRNLEKKTEQKIEQAKVQLIEEAQKQIREAKREADKKVQFAQARMEYQAEIQKKALQVRQQYAQVDFTKKEIINLNHNHIHLALSYPVNVKRGKRIDIYASLENNGKKESYGGINLSFPQFYTSSSIPDIKVFHNDFQDLKSYFAKEKIWNKTLKKAVYPSYFMIESNNLWKKREKHSFAIAIDTPKNINQFRIQVRGALKKRIVPNYGVLDQQGYYTKVITINIID